jgi:hypothetical protein
VIKPRVSDRHALLRTELSVRVLILLAEWERESNDVTATWTEARGTRNSWSVLAISIPINEMHEQE